VSHFSLMYDLGMYRIPVFETRPEPDSTGFLKTYAAGTG